MKEKLIRPLNYIEACKYIGTRLKIVLGDNLISIVIFGSYAMLVPDIYSDIDTLIVVHEVTPKIEEVINEVATDFAITFGRTLSPVVLSSKDIEDSINAVDSFIVFIFWAHDILYDKKNWFRQQMDLLQQKLMKTKKKIIFRRGALVWTLEDLKILQGNITKPR